MVILQAGLPKSGNLWLYKILQNVIRYGGLEQRSFIQNQPIYERAKTWNLSFAGQAGVDVLDVLPHGCFYRIERIVYEPVENIDDYIGKCSHVWTHSSFCERSFTVLPRFDKVVYIIRDPRDVAISHSKFAFTAYMLRYYPSGYADPDEHLAHRLEGKMRNWVWHVGGYLKHRDELNIHVVFYERLLHVFDAEFADLLAYLDMDLDDRIVAKIKDAVSFESMKSQDPHHVRKGEAGEWRQLLTAAQQKQAARSAGPMLELLNYPVDEQMGYSDQMNTLPCLPAQLNHAQLDRAIARGRRPLLMRCVKRAHALIRQMSKPSRRV